MGKTVWGVGVKPTWLLRETGYSALEADPRISPNQKKTVFDREHTVCGSKTEPSLCMALLPVVLICFKQKLYMLLLIFLRSFWCQYELFLIIMSRVIWKSARLLQNTLRAQKTKSLVKPS